MPALGNLHGIVRSVISSVNPNVKIQIQSSIGQTTNPDFTQTPSYASPITVRGQVQPLAQKDLQHTESLNLQGTLRAIYISGHVEGEIRVTAKGGDLITVLEGPNSGLYLINYIDEAWPLWTRCIATLQNGS
jgi:hypothetical protein